jgi:hypothetical protein
MNGSNVPDWFATAAAISLGLALLCALAVAIDEAAGRRHRWQVGMYGGVAALRFGFFHQDLPKGSPPFWLAMQLAVLLGFLTAYLVNGWLLARGIKEAM